MPDRLAELHRVCLHRAGDEAEQIGHDWIDPDHFLLALIAPGEESVAAQSLRDAGVTYEALREAVARFPTGEEDDEAEPTAGLTVAPAGHEVMGAATGIAMVLNEGEIVPEHILLAIIGHPWVTTTDEILSQLGVARRDIAQQLANRGVAVPPQLLTD